MRTFILLFTLVLTLAFQSPAQEMMGYAPGNYAGITGSFLNPSSILDSKVYLDINIIGLHLNVDNNYVYLKSDEYSFKRFLTPGAEFPEHIDEITGESRNYYDNYNADLKTAYSSIRIMGPSAMLSMGRHAFGLSTSYRIMASGNDLPFDLTKFALEGLDFYPQQRINYINNIDFRAAALGAAEIAATWSTVVYRRNRQHLAGGITIKGLFANGGGYGYGDNIDYLVPNSDTVRVFDLNGHLGLSLPLDYENNDITLKDRLFRGSGVGFDIGFTYHKKLKGYSAKAYSAICEVPYADYHYRLGVALIDIGRVNFKKDVLNMELENASMQWNNVRDYGFDNVNSAFRTLSYQFTGDSTQLIKQDQISVSLPTALSVQFDYRINDRFFVNASIVRPVILAEATLIRPSHIAITPRFETHYLEFAMPFTLYNDKYPRLGLSARFHKVIIGTDKLGGFFGMKDFTGLDFYFMVKLQFFKGKCGRFNKRFGCSNLEYLQRY
ncbi:MAG: DUF5723 family protein [Lentimicrobiaceae bacterium]|nr:DUF5723 family protein [Lentimicrobiaceae bacterium]